MKRHITIISLAASALLLGACGDGSSDDTTPVSANSNADNNGSQVDVTEDGLTYHADVRPVLEANCTSCHLAEGAGIAPFGLTDYDEVKPLASLIADSTSDRRMPPWPPSQECSDLAHERVLSQSEIDTIRQWADAGAPEGDPSDFVAPDVPAAQQLGEPDLTLDIGTDYKPNPPQGSIDDHRCFVVEPGIDEDVWLNTHATRPSNLQVAHHMLFFAVPGSAAAELRERADSEPGPGYTCFGGPQTQGTELLGGWVPGSVASAHPPGHGVKIPAGSAIVIQMHYNIVSDPDGTDRTAIDLHFTDGPPQRELFLTPLAKPGINIPAGAREDVERAQFTLPNDVEIFGIAPHMHLLGTSTRAWVDRSDGSETCLVDVPQWDFSWQGFYATKEPIALQRGDVVNLECVYDNSPENQPDGRAPIDVRWGDGTFDEMCITYFVVGR